MKSLLRLVFLTIWLRYPGKADHMCGDLGKDLHDTTRRAGLLPDLAVLLRAEAPPARAAG